MMRPRTMLIAVAAVVLIGILAVSALRRIAPAPEAAPAEPPAAEAPDIADAVPVAPAAAAAEEPPPPWANAAADPGASALAAASISPEEARRAAQMAELQQSMTAMLDDALARSTSSSQHLRQALTTLEAMDDPAVKAQINFEALRHNLGVSDRMQAVAREMMQRIEEPRSPERDQRLEALRSEFTALQGQMRTDVARGGTAPPSAPGPTAR